MGTDRLRLALTVSLSFACAALGAAEAPLLPEVAGCAVVVILLLATLYQRGGRVEVLSIPAANRLGGAMGMVWLGWAAVRVVREVRRAEFTGLGWPVFVVCLFGMLILGLIPAKLLRREKHAGDYWWLLGLGLGAAALAGAMADDAVGFGLLAGYTVAGVWAVAEFHAARSAGRVAPMPGAAAVRVAVKLADRSVRLSLPLSRPLLWAALAAAVAAPLYLVTPRSPFGNLSFVKERVEIGYAADQMVNLNRTGDLKANPEEAFTVVAADAAGRPVDDLDTATRWRGAVLTHYERGGWRRDEYVALPAVEPRARYALQWRPPDFGPDRLRLTFAVPADLRSEFLADPVYWEAGRPVPVADLTPRGPAGWFAFPDGSFVRPPGSQEDGSLVEYVQYTRRGGEPDLGPPVFLTGLPDRVFVTSPVPRVKEYADAVVRAGVAAGRLPAPLGTVPAGVPLPPGVPRGRGPRVRPPPE